MANEPGPQEWTTRERRILLDMRSRGATLQDIADALGTRSRKAVGNFVSRYKIKPYEAPVITAEPPSDEELASEALRQRTLWAIMRFANDNGLDIDSAASRLLSGAGLFSSPEFIHSDAQDVAA